jgi:sulfur carrier protein
MNHVTIHVNGAPRQVAADTTVAALLGELRLDPRHVAVEVNLELVPRGDHTRRALAEGDRLEVVTLVGGG